MKCRLDVCLEASEQQTVVGGEMIEGICLCGSVRWTYEAEPESATACNCQACRRYGVLWAYDYLGQGVHIFGETLCYIRTQEFEKPCLAFHFCRTCGCLAFWQGLEPDDQGRTRVGVNLRLAHPQTVAQLPIRHFDGLKTFSDLPMDGKCVADYWF